MALQGATDASIMDVLGFWWRVHSHRADYVWPYRELLMDLDRVERELKSALRKEQWDKWYDSLPADLRSKLSLNDFKRLGDCFKSAFDVDG